MKLTKSHLIEGETIPKGTEIKIIKETINSTLKKALGILYSQRGGATEDYLLIKYLEKEFGNESKFIMKSLIEKGYLIPYESGYNFSGHYTGRHSYKLSDEAIRIGKENVVYDVPIISKEDVEEFWEKNNFSTLEDFKNIVSKVLKTYSKEEALEIVEGVGEIIWDLDFFDKKNVMAYNRIMLDTSRSLDQ